MEISGAHALVTGASRGLGARIARRLAERGATVTAVARSADAIAALAEETGGHALAADLGTAEGRRDLIRRAADAAGAPVTILVNNAGIDLTGHFPDMSEEDVARLIDVNVTAPAELTRQALPAMLEAGGGSVVMVSSLAGVGAFPGLALYSATKSALTHFAAGLRADLKGLPVAVTVVQTGLITPTDMADSVTGYGPTAASFRRFGALLPDTDADALADDVVRAIEKGTRHVRRPRRSQGFALLSEAPRRTVEWMLAGIAPRDERAGRGGDADR